MDSITNIHVKLPADTRLPKQTVIDLVVAALTEGGFSTLSDEFESRAAKAKSSKQIIAAASKYVRFRGDADSIGFEGCADGLITIPRLISRLEEGFLMAQEVKNGHQKALYHFPWGSDYLVTHNGEKAVRTTTLTLAVATYNDLKLGEEEVA